MSYRVEEHSRRDTWLRARVAGIGGSDAAAVWGVSPYLSPFALYASKVLPFDAQPASNHEDEWLEIGHAVEPVIVQLYEKRTGRKCVDPGPYTILRSTSWPSMSATLDRVVRHPPREQGILQAKNRSAFSLDTFDDGVPLHIMLQATHEAIVFGASWGSIAALVGGSRFVWVDFEVDQELASLHVERCEEFWDKHVVARRPPEVDGTEATRRALEALYRERAGSIVQLGEDAENWAKQYEDAQAAMKAAEALKDEAANHLRALIGEASEAELRSGARISYKTVPASRVEAYERAAYRRLQVRSVRKRVA